MKQTISHLSLSTVLALALVACSPPQSSSGERSAKDIKRLIEDTKVDFVVVLDHDWATSIKQNESKSLRIVAPRSETKRGSSCIAIQKDDTLIYGLTKGVALGSLEKTIIVTTEGVILSGEKPMEAGSYSLGPVMVTEGIATVSVRRKPL